MRHSEKGGRRALLRFVLFLALAIAALIFCNHALVVTDTSRYLMLQELQGRSHSQIAFVGSSAVYYSIDPRIIQEETGKEAIDAAIGNAGLEGCGALVRAFLRDKDAEMVVLTLEPQMLLEDVEAPEAEVRLMPGLRHPLDRVRYLLDLCATDSRWMSRLFYFRGQTVSSWQEFVKTMTISFREEEYKSRMKDELRETPYIGRGYHEMLLSPPEGGLAAHRQFPKGNDHVEELGEATRGRLRRIARDCEKKGVKLIVVIPPCLREVMDSQPHLAEACLLAEEYCSELEISFYNMMRVWEENLPGLQARYVDIYHFDVIGAEMYSHFMGRFLDEFIEGKPVEHWFEGRKGE